MCSNHITSRICIPLSFNVSFVSSAGSPRDQVLFQGVQVFLARSEVECPQQQGPEAVEAPAGVRLGEDERPGSPYSGQPLVKKEGSVPVPRMTEEGLDMQWVDGPAFSSL